MKSKHCGRKKELRNNIKSKPVALSQTTDSEMVHSNIYIQSNKGACHTVQLPRWYVFNGFSTDMEAYGTADRQYLW